MSLVLTRSKPLRFSALTTLYFARQWDEGVEVLPERRRQTGQQVAGSAQEQRAEQEPAGACRVNEGAQESARGRGANANPAIGQRVLLRVVPKRNRERREHGHGHSVANTIDELHRHEQKTHGQHQHARQVAAALPQRRRRRFRPHRRLPRCPRQQPLAWTLARGGGETEDRKHRQRATKRRGDEAEARQQQSAHIAVGRIAQHLAAPHEGVGAAAFVGRQHVDGHAVHGHVLRGGEHVDHKTGNHQHRQRPVVQAIQRQQRGNGGESEKRRHQPALGEQHPRPAETHCRESEAVHQRPGEQLEGPRQRDHAREPGDRRHARLPLGEPRGNRHRQQADGHTLRW